ncbi:TPA: glycosyltransferase family 2 protein, partial [Campylobacter jejuni]
NHKKNQKFYKAMIKINPDLALPPLELYVDYAEALKCKKHLSYMLGSALLKNPFTFIFRVKSIMRDFKRK